MASIGHAIVGMAAARRYRYGHPARRSIITSMTVWSALSLLPDADVIGFRFGVKYLDAWGHRGATHSIAFCLLLGIAIGVCAKGLQLPALRTGVFASLVLLSHPLLDCLTDGGHGCALLWPLSNERYFAPWNPIPVAPIGKRFFTSAGASVAMRELLLLAPVLLYAVWPSRRRV